MYIQPISSRLSPQELSEMVWFSRELLSYILRILSIQTQNEAWISLSQDKRTKSIIALVRSIEKTDKAYDVSSIIQGETQDAVLRDVLGASYRADYQLLLWWLINLGERAINEEKGILPVNEVVANTSTEASRIIGQYERTES